MTNFARTAAVAAFAAATAFGFAQAQETEFDTNQVAEFTKTISFELNTEFAVATQKMEVQYAVMDETTTIKPDMSYASNTQETEKAESFDVAANW